MRAWSTPGRRHEGDGQVAVGVGGGLAAGVAGGQRLAGEAHDLQRALDALGVAGLQAAAAGRGGPARRAAPASRRGRRVLDLAAQDGVGLGEFGQPSRSAL
jgi:hypothetical protein